MRESKRETIVVTEYATDFGTICPDEITCKEREAKEYEDVFTSLYNIASDKQKILLIAIMDELSNHIDSAYCEQSISNDALCELVDNIRRHRIILLR